MSKHADAIRNAIGNLENVETAISALSPLSDAQVQRAAKSLTGRSSTSRSHAMDNIRSYINREHLSMASQRALDETPL